jgi:hypothetical protein
MRRRVYVIYHGKNGPILSKEMHDRSAEVALNGRKPNYEK